MLPRVIEHEARLRASLRVEFSPRCALPPVVEQRDVLQSRTRLGHNLDDLRAALVSEQLEPRIPLAPVRAVRLMVLVKVEVEPQRAEGRRCREQPCNVCLVG